MRKAPSKCSKGDGRDDNGTWRFDGRAGRSARFVASGATIGICGTAVAKASAQAGGYYAGANNKFWRVLHESGLTPELLTWQDYPRLLEWGIGLMDLAKKVSGCDSNLTAANYDVPRATDQIKRYRPSVLCFNGKTAARVFLQRDPAAPIDYGFLQGTVHGARLFVAPSTSAAARKYWDQRIWDELGRSV